MKRVYIAGPMTGLPEFNYPAFRSTAAELRAAGFDVVSPVEVCQHLPPGSTWLEYMRACIPALMTCNAVATLPMWSQSRGARIEVELATTLGFEVKSAMKWTGTVRV